MKKKLKIDVDCANCAAKMESAVKKLDGVTDAAISFMSQRLILEADEDRFDSVLFVAPVMALVMPYLVG